MRSRYGRRAFRAYPIRCVGERIKVTGVPEFREVAWRACTPKAFAEVADLLEEALEDMSIGDDDIETIMEIVDGLKSDIISSDNK